MINLSNTAAMRDWAKNVMTERKPDFTVYQGVLPYLERWWIVPRNDIRNVYLHRFWLSDEDRALHDHRGDNTSWLLEGQYIEHYLPASMARDGITPLTRRVTAGETVSRFATDLHRVELVDRQSVTSLFFIGPTTRDWGFWCPQGWVPWQEFVSIVAGGNDLGRGCG